MTRSTQTGAASAAAADGQGALAITDLSNLFGAIKLYGPDAFEGMRRAGRLVATGPPAQLKAALNSTLKLSRVELLRFAWRRCGSAGGFAASDPAGYCGSS